MAKIRPLDEWVLTERVLSAEKRTLAGLVIPETRFKIDVGTVHEIGPKVTDVKVGDRIVFDRYAGEDVTSTSVFTGADPEQWVLLKQSEILSIDTTGVMTPLTVSID